MRILQILEQEYAYAGLKGRLLLVDPQSLAIASPDFYVRRELDRGHVERLRLLVREEEELPPVVVAYVRELGGYRIVDGNHTAEAHRLEGKPVRLLDIGEMDIVSADRLQVSLNPPGKLSLKDAELREFARRRVKEYALIRGSDRRELINLIATVVNRKERTVYDWVSDLLQEEDRKRKEKAIELLEKGEEKEKVAKDIGVHPRTLERWEKEEKNKKEKPVEVGSRTFWEIFEEYCNLRAPQERGFEGFESYCERKGYQIGEGWREFKRNIFDRIVKAFVLAGLENRDKRHRRMVEALDIPRRVAEVLVGDFEGRFGATLEWEISKLEGLIRQAWEDLPEDIFVYLRENHTGSFYGQYREVFHTLFSEAIRAYASAVRTEEEEEEEEEEVHGDSFEEVIGQEVEEVDDDDTNTKGIGHKGMLRVLKSIREMLEELGEALAKGDMKKAEKMRVRISSLVETSIDRLETSLERRKQTPYYEVCRKAVAAINMVWNYYFGSMVVGESDYGKVIKLLGKAIEQAIERGRLKVEDEKELQVVFINSLVFCLAFNIHRRGAEKIVSFLSSFLERYDEARVFFDRRKGTSFLISKLTGRKMTEEDFAREVEELSGKFWGEKHVKSG